MFQNVYLAPATGKIAPSLNREGKFFKAIARETEARTQFELNSMKIKCSSIFRSWGGGGGERERRSCVITNWFYLDEKSSWQEVILWLGAKASTEIRLLPSEADWGVGGEMLGDRSTIILLITFPQVGSKILEEVSPESYTWQEALKTFAPQRGRKRICSDEFSKGNALKKEWLGV